MKGNFASKYKENQSESSDSSGDELAVPGRALPKPNNDSKIEPKRESQSSQKQRTNKEEDAKIVPYTFNPREFLETINNPTPPPAPKPKPIERTSPEVPSPKKPDNNFLIPRNHKESPKKSPIENESTIPSRTIPNSDVFLYKSGRDSNRSKGTDKMVNQKNPQYEPPNRPEENFAEPRAENEYKSFAKEFDSEFGDHQKEIAALSKQLVTRIKKLQMLERELNSPNVDMGILRTRLSRDLESIEDELGEANHNIVVLMNERKNIKERFCTIRVKYNELKNGNKNFQEGIRKYFYLRKIVVKWHIIIWQIPLRKPRVK